jgi:GntR family transcriptional repressor for pyruvate dehydrogenase complex
MAESPMRIQPVRRLKLSDSVAAELERMILRGDYEIGGRLPSERELADQFGVGRSSMREALRLVEASGLLRIDHGRGVFVAATKKRPPTGDFELRVIDDVTVPELFEVRLAMEGESAGLAARRLTPPEADELQRIVAAAAEPSVGDEDFVTHDARVHRAIATASKNKLLLQIFESIEPLFFTYSYRVIQLPGRRVVAQYGHEQIVQAIVARRPRDARNAMVKHLREVQRDIVEHLEQSDERRKQERRMT